MQIEFIRLKNYKAFRDVTIRNIPRFCVIVGANGTGKSTLFNLFGFLKDAFTTNLQSALNKQGGSRGFQEVRSRGQEGDIEIELKFRIPHPKGETSVARTRLATYFLAINEEKGRPVIKREILQYRRGSKGQSWKFLDFANGLGQAVTNELDEVEDESQLDRQKQEVRSPDILAIKGLSQFTNFPAVKTLGELIENWHVSDFHVNRARPEQEAGYAEHLSKEGENLALVTEFLYQHHRNIFEDLLKKLSERVPGISKVDAKTTEEGRVLLRFQDGAFVDPFLARYVSDGTIKMFAYLILLYAPNPRPLLCVEEPENQLYFRLLGELAEEFRAYSRRGNQVFVSTHSPDFLNAVRIEEVFWLTKEANGYTQVLRAKDDKQLMKYAEEGEQLGYLWSEGFFPNVPSKGRKR